MYCIQGQSPFVQRPGSTHLVSLMITKSDPSHCSLAFSCFLSRRISCFYTVLSSTPIFVQSRRYLFLNLYYILGRLPIAPLRRVFFPLAPCILHPSLLRSQSDKSIYSCTTLVPQPSRQRTIFTTYFSGTSDFMPLTVTLSLLSHTTTLRTPSLLVVQYRGVHGH